MIDYDFDKIFDIAVYITAFSVVVLVGLVVTSLLVSLFTCFQPTPNEYGQLQPESGSESKTNFQRKMLIPNPDYYVWIKNCIFLYFQWFSDFGVRLVIEGLIWLLEIFNFVFNPPEIYPIMIQSVFSLPRLLKISANWPQRDMLNIIVKLILLIVVTAKNCSCDDDETSDIKGLKFVVEVCL